MSKPIIDVINISKRYRIGAHQSHSSLRDSIANIFQRHPHSSTSTVFWALKDISFNIMPGEILGIIGKNGSGKSTLLKILSQITPPTSGSITMRGRVASLLEVGTGFHQELTGRENIFLNGAILGMSQGEIKRKFDEIVDFAEIEKFIDTPVKRYSSGMYVRLAFAIAAHLEPEILIVDEVLAVGDADFQKKSLGKMQSVGQEGRTVLFVSHNIGVIQRLCTKGIMLKNGKIASSGVISKVTQDYLRENSHSEAIVDFPTSNDRDVNITQTKIINEKGHPTTQIPISQKFFIEVSYEFSNPKDNSLLIFVFYSGGDCLFLSAESDKNPQLTNYDIGKYRTQIEIPAFLLNVGNYNFEVAVHQPYIQDFDRKYNINFEITDIDDPKSVIFKGNKFGKFSPILPYMTTFLGKSHGK